jgi:hypothetical protein
MDYSVINNWLDGLGLVLGRSVGHITNQRQGQQCFYNARVPRFPTYQLLTGVLARVVAVLRVGILELSHA